MSAREPITVTKIRVEQCIIQNCCNNARLQIKFGTTRITLCHWHESDLREILNEKKD